MVGRLALALVALGALAVPAEAEVAPRGSVRASDGSLHAYCQYDRLFHLEYSDSAWITGVAVSAPEADVRIVCTVTPRYGVVTKEATGFNVATIAEGATLYGGPTKICVEAWSNHTIDVQEHASACRTYQD